METKEELYSLKERFIAGYNWITDRIVSRNIGMAPADYRFYLAQVHNSEVEKRKTKRPPLMQDLSRFFRDLCEM